MKHPRIYATTSGNTKTVAEPSRTQWQARARRGVRRREGAGSTAESDLMFIGGPTERHALTLPIARFFDALSQKSLRGRATVAFDTRLRWPRFLSGSAANDIIERLRAADARIVAPAESFFVRTRPHGYDLEEGELARARTWAAEVVNEVSVMPVFT